MMSQVNSMYTTDCLRKRMIHGLHQVVLTPKSTSLTGTQHSQAESVVGIPGLPVPLDKVEVFFSTREGSQAQAPFHLVQTESHVCGKARNRSVRRNVSTKRGIQQNPPHQYL